MIYIRNIILINIRTFVNFICKTLHFTFRFEFVFEKILEKNYPEHSNFRFIQVGAHDGISHDELYSFARLRRSSGIVIEPLRDLFLQLQSNYQYNKNIKAINKAVHSSQEFVTLYRVDPAKQHLLPEWTSGIASLDYMHHNKSNLETNFIISEKVEACHLMHIIETESIEPDLDLIQIDVEGYDCEVLKMIDFKQVRPKIIRLEYISLSEKDMIVSKQILQREGYCCFIDTLDLVGVNIKLLKL